jgi:hypothetical protein
LPPREKERLSSSTIHAHTRAGFAAFVACIVAAALAMAAASAASAPGWVTRPTPTPSGSIDDVLMGVSCVSAQNCVAVGGPDDGPGLALVERSSGGRWSIAAVRQPAGTEQGLLRGVSCASKGFCMAVGEALSGAGVWSGFIERRAGAKWSFALIPKQPGWRQTFLQGVSCTSRTSCTAVGGYETRAEAWFPLAERWDGSRWLIQPAGRIQYGQLEAVSCISKDECIAVGTGVSSQLIERWRGASWSLVKAPNTGSAETNLEGVSCASGMACTAVGQSAIVDVAASPLAERWNGTTWRLQLPVMGLLGDLHGVSCGSPRSCTAVGEGALIERWNGARWLARQPSEGVPEKSLYGVSCVSANICTAVGSTVNSAGREAPLAEALG